MVALCLLVSHLAYELLKCTNIAQFVSVFLERALEINDYDFYLLLFNHYKDKNTKSSIGHSEQIELIKQSMPSLQNVMAENL